MDRQKKNSYITEFEHEEKKEYIPVEDDSYEFEPSGFYYRQTEENWGDFDGFYYRQSEENWGDFEG